MISGIHFLLTYTCLFECDHCFLYCSPGSEGTFTIEQIENVLDEAEKAGSVNSIYLEGGEPFLFYPVMLEAARLAVQKKMTFGIVTNAYWATSVRDAEIWLRPFAELGIADLSISEDELHGSTSEGGSTSHACEAAIKLGIPKGKICIDKPVVVKRDKDDESRGKPIVGGDVQFRGRAAANLIEGLPRIPSQKFDNCPHEELVDPGRVHVDPFGNVFICQGLSMGNMWQTPLSELIKNYDAHSHPIIGPLVKGGPYELARKYDVPIEDGYVDACHMCYDVRKKLIERFPEYLTPPQVYGLDA